MYTTVLILHSLVKWLVLLALILTLYRSYKGYFYNLPYYKIDNSIRHWTVTIAHIQLVLGIILYAQSPIIQYFWRNLKDAFYEMDIVFFGLIHFLLMCSAIIVLTIGSALAKRKLNKKDKYKTTVIWFTIALLIILIAIPWPFSPLSNRPYIRTF
ncbi:hypothetical protein [Aquimarina algiphila]|uniref:hypothetical protein n=1 Tax=Aquimarina algiphila TaxID=2047982 RepID=UPI00232E8DE4|nr:hypothetical protein [Aquimarina algiphila]